MPITCSTTEEWIVVDSEDRKQSVYMSHAEFDALVADVTAFRAKQREARIAKLNAEADALGLVVVAKSKMVIPDEVHPNLSMFGEDKEDE